MTNKIIQQLEAEQMNKSIPPFAPGDTVIVQVKVKEGDDADDIFSKLMGELVEPRRDFIQENALSAIVDA